MSENNKLNTGILKDVGFKIDAWLDSSLPRGWKKGRAPHFSHKSTYLTLLKEGINQSVDFLSLIQSIDARIRSNLGSAKRQPSQENWRDTHNDEVSDKNESPEVCLERQIVGQQKRKKWANQVPVASGLLDSDSDKGRHVDLVREIEQGATYELIELKWGADNPFFAALEILCYGLIYLLFREKFPQPDKPLLQARTIHLRVLAPEDYYRGKGAKKALATLEFQISEALGKHAVQADLKMDFCFLKIPFSEIGRVIIEADADMGMPPAVK
jgi:hypothetical protein